MRSLIITARSSESIVIPLAYNELLQGVLYSCWRDSYPNLHDRDSGMMPKLFTFGPLVGGRPLAKDRTYIIDGIVHFEVRSIEEDLLDDLAMRLSEKGELRIGAHHLMLTNLQSADRLLFPKRMFIKTASPITVHRSQDDGHTVYYSPDEDDFTELVQGNLLHKLEMTGLECSDKVDLIPISGSIKKRVTRFKGTYITGYTGKFIMQADPQAVALLYSTGLGSRNSQGFGMFNIEDEPL